MANKDFREIQVSSSLLVVIFLGVLALGVFIFLLGVSVGKKQAGVTAPAQIVTQQIPEPAKEAPVKPAASDTASSTASGTTAAPPDLGASGAPAGTTAAKTPVKETILDKPPASKPAADAKKTAPPPARSGAGLYYVQVAAF